jgi:hypothetical protein
LLGEKPRAVHEILRGTYHGLGVQGFHSGLGRVGCTTGGGGPEDLPVTQLLLSFFFAGHVRAVRRPNSGRSRFEVLSLASP